MEFWEFNAYVKGYKDVFYNEQMNIMKLAYYTGGFSRDTGKKPKPLEHYLNIIEKQFDKNETKNIPVDREKSMDIHDKIQKLKGVREDE